MTKLYQALFKIVILSLVVIGLSGCQSFGRKFKAFLNGGKTAPKKVAAKRPTAKSYSQQPNYYKAPNRKYKRTTRKSLENSNGIEPRTGSLWVMEGQGAYLFSQNIMRMIGDPIAVRIEGEPRQQLESKSKVIKDLLDKLEERRLSKARRIAAARKAQTAAAKPGAQGGEQQKADDGQKQDENKEGNANASAKKGEGVFPIQSVPTRIVERMVDGNYRIKGSQPFLIGRREYKAIVTGIVRAEDFSEDGISATRLIDPKFDIVSSRRSSASL